jgi:hypothetical protein
VKWGRVGIQRVLHIGREDELWILKQAPLERNGIEWRLPFHNHEEVEWEWGREKSWNGDTYL